MTAPTIPPIFDGHNDVLSKISADGGVSQAESFAAGRVGHMDGRRCKQGGFGGGFFSVFVRSPLDLEARREMMAQPAYDLELPEPIDWANAMSVALAQIATLDRLEKLGELKVCRTASEVSACLINGPLAAILHFEGAEAIDTDLHALDVFYRAGLRSIGPVWSRPTIFGHGVPFRFPSNGDTGPGLTERGTALVKQCNALGIMVDLSHLNEAGFWDVAHQSIMPLIATHSNAHAICPHARNLTDRQLAAIRESDGIVGVNFAVAFLREDGRMIDTGLDQILRHLDHLINELGEDRVGFGSDFDGTQIPETLGSVAGLPNLRQHMLDHGYN
jgi:membrane dipeptidase